MTRYYEEFVRLRKNGKLSFADVMRIEGEQKLIVNMTEDDIKALHQNGYLPGMIASAAIRSLKAREAEAKTPALASA